MGRLAVARLQEDPTTHRMIGRRDSSPIRSHFLGRRCGLALLPVAVDCRGRLPLLDWPSRVFHAILQWMDKPKMTFTILLLGLLALIGCATYPAPDSNDPATRQIAKDAVLYDGPELVAVVGYPRAQRSLGDEWLTLAVELTSRRGNKAIAIARGDITLRTPDGRRLKPISQEEYRSNFPRLRIPVERSLRTLPLLYRYEQDREPCGRWFFVSLPGEIAFDEVTVSSFQACSGPLIFKVRGGVQPGRWRLVIELEESRADIPFILE
jgi:hypothetical protein